MYLYCVWEMGKVRRGVISVHSPAMRRTPWHAKVGEKRNVRRFFGVLKVNGQSEKACGRPARRRREVENEKGECWKRRESRGKWNALYPFFFFLNFNIFHLGHCFNLGRLLSLLNPIVCLEKKSADELERMSKLSLLFASEVVDAFLFNLLLFMFISTAIVSVLSPNKPALEETNFFVLLEQSVQIYVTLCIVLCVSFYHFRALHFGTRYWENKNVLLCARLNYA